MSNAIEYPKFRWFVYLTMLIGVMSQGVVMISPSPIIGQVSEYLGQELGFVTMTVMGFWTITVCLGGIIGGFLVDKVGVAKVYIVCAILLAISAEGIYFAGTHMGLIIFLRLIGGAGVGPLLTSIARLAVEWFPEKERKIVIGTQGLCTSLGVAVGLAIAPQIYVATQSFPLTMSYVGIFPVVLLVCAIIFLLGPQAPGLTLLQGENPADAAADFKAAMKGPVVYLCILMIFIANWLLQGINDLTPGYFAIPEPVGIGWGPVVAGQMMMIFQITYMIGAICTGFLTDYVYKGNFKLQLAITSLLTGVYFFVRFRSVTGAGPNALLLVVMLITAFFMGQAINTVSYFITKRFPEHITGRVGGTAMGIGLLGGTVGVAFGSMAITATGTYLRSITIVTIVALIGFVVALFWRDPAGFKQKVSDN